MGVPPDERGYGLIGQRLGFIYYFDSYGLYHTRLDDSTITRLGLSLESRAPGLRRGNGAPKMHAVGRAGWRAAAPEKIDRAGILAVEAFCRHGIYII